MLFVLKSHLNYRIRDTGYKYAYKYASFSNDVIYDEMQLLFMSLAERPHRMTERL